MIFHKTILSLLFFALTVHANENGSSHGNIFKEESSSTGTTKIINGVEQRIIGGWDAPLNKYPWFVLLKTRYWWPTGCGAMLVAPEWCLTAAHCLQGGVNVQGVEIGKFCRDENNCNQAKESFAVDRVVIDPLFNIPGSMSHDLALVKLSGRSSTTPVTMDSGYSPSFLDGRKNIMAIGFGDSDRGSLDDYLFPSKLQEVEVKYVSISQCREILTPSIKDEMLCAGENYEGACVGDSGGPLWDAEMNMVIGVTSFGNTCTVLTKPAVFARISSRYDWITDTICADHSNPKPSYCGGQQGPNPMPTPVTKSPTRSPTSSPTRSPTSSPTKRAPDPNFQYDECIDSPIDWYDADGPQYDCAWYANGSNCQYHGNSYVNMGKTANQACCACGGGNSSKTTSGPTSSPTVETASPTDSPTSKPSSRICYDDPSNWVDNEGFDCHWYSDRSNCQYYGHQYIGLGGKTAIEACCVCNGGTFYNVPAPTPNFAPNQLPSGCVDSPLGWYDSDGPQYDCDFYGQGSNCESIGDFYENDGKTANEACCVCGGGVNQDIDDD